MPAGLQMAPGHRATTPGLLAGLVALACVVTVALVYATLEVPRWLVRVARDWVDIPDYHPAIEPEAIVAFLDSSLIRPIGYACLAVVLALVVAGLLTRRSRLASAGAVLLFLPTVGAFAGYMFFLAGLGVLRALWLPAWSGWMALGDIAYLPYIAIVWPFSLTGVDARGGVALGSIALGLFILVSSTTAWFLARFEGRPVADVWLYRVSRHPQYLGWLVWSWGFMLLSAQQPIPMAGENPGAALPWLVGSLAIVAVAWAEEARMLREHGPEYAAYRERTAFLVPLPQWLRRAAGAPVRFVLRKDAPETGRDALIAFLATLGLAVLASLPFLLADWPPGGWWAWPQWGLTPL